MEGNILICDQSEYDFSNLTNQNHVWRIIERSLMNVVFLTMEEVGGGKVVDPLQHQTLLQMINFDLLLSLLI